MCRWQWPFSRGGFEGFNCTMKCIIIFQSYNYLKYKINVWQHYCLSPKQKMFMNLDARHSSTGKQETTYLTSGLCVRLMRTGLDDWSSLLTSFTLRSSLNRSFSSWNHQICVMYGSLYVMKHVSLLSMLLTNTFYFNYSGSFVHKVAPLIQNCIVNVCYAEPHIPFTCVTVTMLLYLIIFCYLYNSIVTQSITEKDFYTTK